MSTKPILVIGIHREELEFGEQVARYLKRHHIDVLRIPKGIPQNRNPAEQFFYHKLRHREIYMQLRQQVVSRYNLVLDLHAGVNTLGHCADVYCHNESLLVCLDKKCMRYPDFPNVHTVHIVAESKLTTQNDKPFMPKHSHLTHAVAHTLIPPEVWNSREFLYVGVEIYLTAANGGTEDDWSFTRTLIAWILKCTKVQQVAKNQRQSLPQISKV
jgi:hypothetical protein